MGEKKTFFERYFCNPKLSDTFTKSLQFLNAKKCRYSYSDSDIKKSNNVSLFSTMANSLLRKKASKLLF